MKLYGKITSERASKGQGGKWLDIKVFDEEKDELLSIYIDKDEDDWYKAHIKTPDGKTDFQELLRETKAKSYCDIQHDWEYYPDGYRTCQKCGKTEDIPKAKKHDRVGDLLKAIEDNTDKEGKVSVQYIADEVEELKAKKQKSEKLYYQSQNNCEHLYRDASDKRYCVDCGKKLD